MHPSNTMKQIAIRLICWAAAVVALAVLSHAAEPENAEQVDVVQVRPNFYMIAGAGGNIGVQIGSDGVVLVNAGTDAHPTRFWRPSRNLPTCPSGTSSTPTPMPDFVGGNAKLAKAGQTIFTNLLGNAELAKR